MLLIHYASLMLIVGVTGLSVFNIYLPTGTHIINLHDFIRMCVLIYMIDFAIQYGERTYSAQKILTPGAYRTYCLLIDGSASNYFAEKSFLSIKKNLGNNIAIS